MHQMPSPNDRLVVEGDFTAFKPQELFDHFVTASLLTQWWPEKAQVNPGVGGDYRLEWPDMGWVLTGKYTTYEPGKHLVMTWHWNHDPDHVPERTVDLTFAPAVDGGTVLTIVHATYGDSETEQQERQGHLEGWIHFGMKLAGLRPGSAE